MPFLTQILDQLRGNRELLMIALAVAFAVYNWGYLKSLLPKLQSAFAWLTTRTPSVAAPAVESSDVLGTIRKLRTKFKDKPEALAALKVVWTHLLDVDGGEA